MKEIATVETTQTHAAANTAVDAYVSSAKVAYTAQTAANVPMGDAATHAKKTETKQSATPPQPQTLADAAERGNAHKASESQVSCRE